MEKERIFLTNEQKRKEGERLREDAENNLRPWIIRSEAINGIIEDEDFFNLLEEDERKEFEKMKKGWLTQTRDKLRGAIKSMKSIPKIKDWEISPSVIIEPIKRAKNIIEGTENKIRDIIISKVFEIISNYDYKYLEGEEKDRIDLQIAGIIQKIMDGEERIARLEDLVEEVIDEFTQLEKE